MKNELRRCLILLTLFLTLAAPAVGLAQDPEPGKDHSLVSRLPNFIMVEHRSNFDQMTFPLAGEKIHQAEGRITFITYEIKEDAPKPSELQIVRNYINAVKKMGGQVIFEGEHPEFPGRCATLKLVRGKAEVWILVQAFAGGGSYYLGVLEIGQMKQEVAGGDLRQALERQGRVTLHINFDSGKSTIRSESEPILDQAAKMMINDPGLKIRVDGHTDNIGSASANLTLSLKRAEAVAQALIRRGVTADRLAAAGYGQALPLADNGSDSGRAKNRRVELVKM